MNLVIAHHHLNRGGVTQVVRNELLSLAARPAGERPRRVFLLHGGRRLAWPDDLERHLDGLPVAHLVHPGIDYDEEARPPRVEARPDELAGDLDELLRGEGCTPGKTVLHVHNPSLGKNLSLPGALDRLARQGWAVLAHVHDFAEDGRPANWTRIVTAGVHPLHPRGRRVHTAVLTSRDLAVLRAAGRSPDRSHLLPNPVPMPAPGCGEGRDETRRTLETAIDLPRTARLLLYPVRGIRRKNLGEALLWALLGEGRWHLGVTQDPLNPAERPLYHRWVDLSRELELPVHFELGRLATPSFEALMASADAFLTTSVTEGFGMVFLEALLADRPLLGRDLPAITRDFVDAGLAFPHLAEALLVPASWIDVSRLIRDVTEAFRRMRSLYGKDAGEDELLRLRRPYDGELVDFGLLWEEEQEEILRRLAASAADRDRLRRINPTTARLRTEESRPRDGAASARAIVDARFGLAVSGERLVALHRATSTAAPGTPEDFREEGILDAFLAPESFRPLRVPRPDGRWTS